MPDAEELRRLKDSVGEHCSFVIAADGGARTACALGLMPDLLVGDLDSLTPPEVESLMRRGCKIHKFPTEKDKTDAHLALEWADANGFQDITMLIQSKGRLDHVLGIILAAYKYVDQGSSVRFVDQGFEAVLVKGPAAVEVLPGRPLTVSLLPLTGTARGITITGMKYSLRGEDLFFGESRGISNETTGKSGRIELSEGWLLVTAMDSGVREQSRDRE